MHESENGISFECKFRHAVRGLIDSYSSERVALFFLGFSAWQMRIVLSEPEAVAPPKETWFDADSCLDLSVVDSAEAARSLALTVCSSNGIVLGAYEHFSRIRGSLGDLYDGRIIIVKNNLFDKLHKVPCCASPRHLASLCDYFEKPDEKMSEEAYLASKYYAEIEKFNDGYFVSPIRYDVELGCEEVSLFDEGCEITLEGEDGTYPMISVPSSDYAIYKYKLCQGSTDSATFMLDENMLSNGDVPLDFRVLLSLLRSLGVSFGIRSASHFPKEQEEENRLLPYFRKYWGEDKKYRALRFYKNPDAGNEMIEISQGYIAEEVVSQSLIAMESDDSYQNIFVTAPTGAGKSLLFQLPAIFLAERYKAVTIVIEPTKSLMNDQVSALRKRGIAYATALNTDISYVERMFEITEIQNGNRSIVYLSPELLLSSSIEDIIGDRVLGLVVVDEAHTVTLWGKDFRSDYWFLGSFLSKVKKLGRRFPIFCLTATAVYGGVDDVVWEVITELELEKPKLFLGNVRRDDISFDINVKNKKDHPGPIDVVKIDLAVDRIEGFLHEGSHSLVYCPYRSHVDAINEACSEKGFSSQLRVMKYHSGLDAAYKGTAQKKFTDGHCRVMICTKAFGMGIDVDDISHVYHFAPTGNLADYIQEIGRGARREDVTAVATIDFFPTDARYYAQLYGMSTLSQKQLREIMKKLYATYASGSSRRQNFLISPDSFSYLFGESSDAVNKTKQALMMISKDLESRYGFPVVVVRSKPSYTKNYVCFPDSICSEIIAKYGSYMREVLGNSKREMELGKRRRDSSPVFVRPAGPTYEVNMAKLWEDHFSDTTFSKFKWEFFKGNIFGVTSADRPSPRQRLEIKYKEDFASVSVKFRHYMEAVESVFLSYKVSGREFTARQFKKAIAEKLDSGVCCFDFPDQILNAFTIKPSEFFKQKSKSAIRVLAKKTSKNSPEPKYRVQDKSFLTVASRFCKKLSNCRPFTDRNSYVVFLSKDAGTREEIDLASLLELFGLASYEARGGDGAEIFIRLNDPSKVQALANDPRYRNGELFRLSKRHENSRGIITSFFMADLNDKERWDLVESYFLGEDEHVAAVLNAAKGNQGDAAGSKKRKAKKGDAAGFEADVLPSTGMSMESMPYDDIWDYVLDDCSSEWEELAFESLRKLTAGSNCEKPIYDVDVHIPSSDTKLSALLAWPESKTLLFLENDAADYELACDTNWDCHLVTPEFQPEKLAERIKR